MAKQLYIAIVEVILAGVFALHVWRWYRWRVRGPRLLVRIAWRWHDPLAEALALGFLVAWCVVVWQDQVSPSTFRAADWWSKPFSPLGAALAYGGLLFIINLSVPRGSHGLSSQGLVLAGHVFSWSQARACRWVGNVLVVQCSLGGTMRFRFSPQDRATVEQALAHVEGLSCGPSNG